MSFIALGLIFVPKLKDRYANSEDLYPAIKINLVNGCGYQGVATNIAELLTNMSIDVVHISNARKFIYNETIIVVKKYDEDELSRLKKTTGIKNVIYAVNESFPVPFLIVIGKDYQTYFCKDVK